MVPLTSGPARIHLIRPELYKHKAGGKPGSYLATATTVGYMHTWPLPGHVLVPDSPERIFSSCRIYNQCHVLGIHIIVIAQHGRNRASRSGTSTSSTPTHSSAEFLVDNLRIRTNAQRNCGRPIVITRYVQWFSHADSHPPALTTFLICFHWCCACDVVIVNCIYKFVTFFFHPNYFSSI